MPVRPAEETDAAALLALRAQLFSETDALLWEPAEFNDTVEDERQRILRLAAQPNSTCLLALDGSRVVGFLSAMGPQVNRLRHGTALALGVLRSHWGRGIGTELLAAALAWSKQAGLRRVELHVRTDNARAIALYRRAGFEIEGTRRAALCIRGRLVDDHVMSFLHEP